MKRGSPRRIWSDANEKRTGCRICGEWNSELAHTIGRKHDERRGNVYYVHPDSVVPLCKHHHDRFDGRAQPRLDLLGHLTLDEELMAVRQAGGIEQARVRLAPSCYRLEAA